MSTEEMAPIQQEWVRISGQLRSEIGEAAYQSWLKPMAVRGVGDGRVTMSVPTRFMRDWVLAHYLERLCSLWEGANPNVQRIDVIVQSERSNGFKDLSPLAPQPKCGVAAAPRRGAADPVAATHSARGAIVGNGASSPPAGFFSELNDDISAPLDTRLTFDNFVVGKPNEFAYAAARRIASGERAAFNPLFLYGGVGLGKTHLMHAICWEVRRQTPRRSIIYLTAEKFMYRFIRALREQATVDFKDQFRSVDMLMIDDVQFISGKESTQEEFFHTFNALVDQGRQIVLSADKSPSDLEGIQERLKSRLNCGLVADIHATTFELRLGILHSKAEQLKVEIPRKVMEFLAHRITSNVRELEGALNRVVAHAQLVGRDITLETSQEVLQDLLRAADRRVTIEDIQKQVATHFNIRVSDMHSARRARAVARPRQVAMFLAKQLTTRSLPEIGRKFGNRDHTTVMHAVRKIEELTASDGSFAEDVELLRRMLES
ncbi:MAG: chromosomal replication initiator protein DnaA [Rhodospirillales bacterium]|nr:chromosomal replication initiator protein DnaA [Rhodospirillales bacterium]